MERKGSADNLLNSYIPLELKLLEGEEFKDNFSVTFIDPKGTLKGVLTLTNYRLFFVSHGYDKDMNRVILDVPLGNIFKIKGFSLGENNRAHLLEVKCKEVRKLWFQYDEQEEGIENFGETLPLLAFPKSHNGKVFAYSYKGCFPENGWKLYDPLNEYKRMGLKISSTWRISYINRSYKLCETYPGIIVVPSKTRDEDLSEVAKYRSDNRIPVLSWINPRNLSTITRCSQPMVGMKNLKSNQDEAYIKALRCSHSSDHKLVIFDARPMKKAMASLTKGGGYESQDSYEEVTVEFLKIENCHVMQESYIKLCKLCLKPPGAEKWPSSLESTNWLKHIESILSGAVKIAENIDKNRSVLVHCSGGTDRTSQLTSLSMLILDPYYRTIKGFEVLIEKEWLSFGHKFQSRIGHGDENYADGQRSPVFIQFIDCVWQITRQYPTAMEFNEHFLLTILDELYNCRFGTFLFNSEQERATNLLQDQTVSLWSWINLSVDSFKNPKYDRRDIRNFILRPVASKFYLNLWDKYYCKWNESHEKVCQMHLSTLEMLKKKPQMLGKGKILQRMKELKVFQN